MIALVGAAAAIGWIIQALCRGRPLGALIQAALIGILVAARSLFCMSPPSCWPCATAGWRPGERRSAISSGATRRASTRHGVARAAIESLAENFSDGVIAPVFWYLFVGLPGLFAYK